MIKAVLFDVDGVLIDSLEGNARIFSYDLQRLGGKPISAEEYRRFYFMSAKSVLRHFFPEKTDQELEDAIAEGLKVYPRFFKYMKLNANVLQTLEKISRNLRLGIVTNRINPDILDYLKIRHYFSAIVCLPDVKNTKPHPEPINLALKRLKAIPEEAVYVGDSPSDLEAGKAAGVKVIIYRNPSVKGDYNIKDFREIPKIVEKLNSK